MYQAKLVINKKLPMSKPIKIIKIIKIFTFIVLFIFILPKNRPSGDLENYLKSDQNRLLLLKNYQREILKIAIILAKNCFV